MKSQLILTACGVFAAILALALSFYIKHKDIFDKRIKIIFIILLFIDFIVFAYALTFSPDDVNSPPMVVSLMPDKSSPQYAGTTIKWTSGAFDPENDRVQYKFLLDGQQKTDWSYDSTWYWTTSNADIGSHAIEIKAKDGNHNADGDDTKDIEFTISHQQNQLLTPETTGSPSVTTSNQHPSIKDLTPVPNNSPQPAGTTIAWTTGATDPEDDQIFYRYFLNGKSETSWNSENTWTWKTNGENIGENHIEVQVRDENHVGPDGFDDHKSSSFSITKYETKPSSAAPELASPPAPTTEAHAGAKDGSNSPPIVNSITSDKTSPQSAGTIIKWTTKATDTEDDPILYRFWLKGPSTGNAWKVVADWSTDNQWTWSSTSPYAGIYRVFVYARDGKHAPATAYDSARGQDYMLLV
jgi:hypothetical protein